MKRYLTYLVLVALSSATFFTAQPTPAASADVKDAEVAAARRAEPNVFARVKETKAPEPVSEPSLPPKDVPQAPPVEEKPEPPAKPAFNATEPSTWPQCAENQIVRADTGACEDKKPVEPETQPEPAAVVAAAPAAAPTDKFAIMAAAGIPAADYQYVDYIVSKESSWQHLISNASSGAYGLCQSLPASKMATAGSDWQSNPVTQLKWCHSYAISRYGSWAAAYSFWTANHWW